MLRPYDLLAFALRAAVAGLALAILVILVWPGAGTALRTRLGLATPPQPAAAAVVAPASYADAVARAAPAVVNIYANRTVLEQPLRAFSDPLLQQLLGPQAYGPARPRRVQNLGSGVIVSSKGYVLTNNHVIAGADNIQVMLYDGRVARATVIGSDRDTDLAVLKIDVHPLPAVAIEDPRPVRVGDVVLAIGNPLGIGQTVTMGIVSALGRQLSLSTDEDFIQTDAAINSGNSGGALVNSLGELVGINTAMLGRASGAEGISFAIPVRTARMVLEQIIRHGRVVRGWMGADYAPIALTRGGLPMAARGAIVTEVYPGGPAAEAGLRPGDVLLRIDKTDILDPADLRQRESALAPGSEVTLSGLRLGVPFHVRVQLAERPPQPMGLAPAG
jgi:serine protease DegS/serine protease DegQ